MSYSRSALRAERFERPLILLLIVTQNVNVPVIRGHTKIRRTGRIPFVVHSLNRVRFLAGKESQRPLVCLVSRIALDSYFAHFSRLCGAPLALLL